MSQDYHPGMRVEEINEGTRTITTVSTAVVGLVCTGDDAATFRLNRPVLLTDILTFSGRVGYWELQTDQAIRETPISREV